MSAEAGERGHAEGAERDLFGKVPVGRRDWAHRRREPRALAFFWLVYLIVSSALVVSVAASGLGASETTVRPAARMMVCAVMVGLTVLWPMLRLSQADEGRGVVSGVWRDLLVLVPPAWAVLAVQPLLVGWSVTVALGLCVLVGVWGVLSGGLLALCEALVRRGVRSAGVAGLLIAVLLVGGTLLARGLIGRTAEDRADWAAMLGPVSGGLELTRWRPATGTPVAVYGEHWRALAAVGLAGVGVWLVVGAVVGGGLAGRSEGR